MNKKILDIGAGSNPDKRATDAIDESITPAEIKTAKKKSKKLEQYHKGDFRHPSKEQKQVFDKVVSHFAPDALEDKSASKALDYVTKEDATAEIEVGISDAPQIVQVLHDADFKTTSVEATSIPYVTPASGIITGNVTIKAEKKEGYGEKAYYPMPIRIKLPCRKQSQRTKLTKRHKNSEVTSLAIVRR